MSSKFLLIVTSSCIIAGIESASPEVIRTSQPTERARNDREKKHFILGENND
ncbi:hypothetical protein Nit79A3_0292 [Nitrosomonas sp. Is79A3]